MTDDVSIAYMQDLKAPLNTTGRGTRQKAIQKGTIFSGFTLSEVHHDKVVMLRGEERIEIKVTEQQNKKERSSIVTPSTSTVKTEIPDSEVKSAAEKAAKSRIEVRASPVRNERGREKEQQPTERRTQRRNPNTQ